MRLIEFDNVDRGSMDRKVIIKTRDGGYLLPNSKITITQPKLRLLLSRIPVSDRKLIPRKRKLFRMAKEAIGRLAANLYGIAWEKENEGKKTAPGGWWNFGKGTFRPQFEKAWIGYESGFMPEKMIQCALYLSNQGAFRGNFPRPGHVFGPYVLSHLIGGWEPDEIEVTVQGSIDAMKTPIPLERARIGPDAFKNSPRSKRPSIEWRPGLVFDVESGLYVPPEMAGEEVVDVAEVSGEE